MDFDFPLILLVATVVTGVITLFDKVVLSKRRERLAIDNSPGEGAESTDRQPSFLVEQARSFFPVLAIVFVLRSFVAEPFQIPSGSMEPGLITGDFIVVSKFHYGFRMPVFGSKLIPTGEPERGDVMVFFPPDDPRYFIKRVIGLPGDVVVYKNKRLTINDQLVPTTEHGGIPEYRPVKYLATEQLGDNEASVQWLVARDTRTQQKIRWAGPEGSWEVPEGHYFMMGDNRGNSGDSRMWGFVPEENIVGKALAVWMHWESWSDLPSFSRNQIIR